MSWNIGDWRWKMRFASHGNTAVRVFAILLAVSALGLAAGCGGSYGIETKTSGDGTTTRTLANSEIKIEGAMKYTGSDERDYKIEKQCFLDYRSRETASGETTYEIVLTYMGAEELGIEPGRSLEFVADLNSYVLTADGPGKKQRDPTGKSVTETLVYPVSGERLLSISEAGSVKVIINGRAGEAKGSFDDVNFASLRRFVAECVRPAGSGSPQK